MVWKFRNGLLFDEDFVLPSDRLSLILIKTNSFQHSWNVMKVGRVNGGRHEVLVGCHLPRKDWVKVNTDGAL